MIYLCHAPLNDKFMGKITRVERFTTILLDNKIRKYYTEVGSINVFNPPFL